MAAGGGKLATIQSLRALAIGVVLFYHINSKWVPRGFLGVDMFFVISGYLMAKIFYEKGSSFGMAFEFYRRRFKRIMPCYGLTIAIIVWIGRTKLGDVDRDNLFTDALLSLGIISNMQPFYTKFDYWQMISEYKFLAHTWSLSCEMQFYILVPLIFLLLQKSNNFGKSAFCIFFCFVSLNGLIVLPPSQSFGFVFCRLWQFIAGIAVHLILIYQPKKLNLGEYKRVNLEESEEVDELLNHQGLSKPEEENEDSCHVWLSMVPYITIGLFFINLALSFIEPIPIIIARPLIVFTTAGIILGSQIKESRLLTLQPMPYIGDISYVLYLVHWPVITFYKVLYSNGDELTPYDESFMLAMSILISLASHHFVENHFLGEGAWLCFPFTFVCYLVAISGVFLPIQSIGSISNEDVALTSSIITKDCKALSKMPSKPNFENYTQRGSYSEHLGILSGDGNFDVFVTGNSYLQHYPNWPDKIFKERYRTYYHHDISTCVPFLDYRTLHNIAPTCEKFNERVMSDIERIQPKIVMLVIGYGLANDLISVNFDKMFPTALERIKRIAAATNHLLITYPMYYLSENKAHQNSRIFQNREPLPPRNESQFLYEDYLDQCGHTLSLLFRIVKKCPNCQLIDTQSIFCEDGVHCDVFDYDCGRNLYDWGGRHPTTFARNRMQVAYQLVVDRLYQQIADDELS